MGASIGGIPFTINPTSVSWDYSVKSSSDKTIGGKVIQIYGVTMGDLVVTGQFGNDGVARQRDFYNRLSELVDKQVPSWSKPVARTALFEWPEKGWSFNVYIKAFTQTGSPVSIQEDVATHNPRFTLTLFVEDQNTSVMAAVKDTAASHYLSRLTAGLGWKVSQWNGPRNAAELRNALDGATILQSMFGAYTGSTQSTPITPSTPTGNQD